MLGVNVNDVLSIVKEAFLVRPCTTPIKDGKVKKECLNYHIGLCLSPCSGKCDKNEYLVQVKKAMDFLSGNDRKLILALVDHVRGLHGRQTCLANGFHL